jgi:hypothetical protein
MKALVVAVLVTVGIGSVAVAQQRTVRDMMNDMKARYGQTFDQCQALATSRGYRLSDSEQEGRLVMMFIEGCIMGKQSWLIRAPRSGRCVNARNTSRAPLLQISPPPRHQGREP